MSRECHRTDHDPRTYVARCGFFTQRPDIVKQYLWDLGLPTAAERVFWFHWREGMRAGDWCSSIPIKVVAARCRLDVSTVTRAYQVLKAHELIRRESSGRDPLNPFQQATAVTEIRLPRSLVSELSRMPKRPMRPADLVPEGPKPEPVVFPARPEDPVARARERAVIRKMGAQDSRQFMAALDAHQTTMVFSPQCPLNAEERQVVLEALVYAAATPPKAPVARVAITLPSMAEAPNRRLSQLELVRLQARVRDVVAGADASEAGRQVAWSMQHGALRRYPVNMALNIATKKLREGCWTRPNRMPPNWAFLTAVPELCGAA